MDKKNWIAICLIACAVGLINMGSAVTDLSIPITSELESDPREIFFSLGAALTGPVGVLISNMLAWLGQCIAGECTPGNLWEAKDFADHLASGLFAAFVYKKWVYPRENTAARLASWAALILAYYYIVWLPVRNVMVIIRETAAGNPAVPGFFDTYISLAPNLMPEAVITILITSLVWMALPRRHHRPLW